MPDYSADIEYAAPDFGRAEFRMLRRQLVPLLDARDEVSHVHTDRPSRTIRAGVAVAAASSSAAEAKAAALARALKARLTRVRTSRITLHVELREQGPSA